MKNRIEKLAWDIRVELLQGRGFRVAHYILGKSWPIQDLMLAIVLASDDTMTTGFKGLARSLFMNRPSELFAYQNCLELEVTSRALPVKEVLLWISDLECRDQLAIVALMAWYPHTRAELKEVLTKAVENPAGLGWEVEHVGSESNERTNERTSAGCLHSDHSGPKRIGKSRNQ